MRLIPVFIRVVIFTMTTSSISVRTVYGKQYYRLCLIISFSKGFHFPEYDQFFKDNFKTSENVRVVGVF